MGQLKPRRWPTEILLGKKYLNKEEHRKSWWPIRTVLERKKTASVVGEAQLHCLSAQTQGEPGRDESQGDPPTLSLWSTSL